MSVVMSRYQRFFLQTSFLYQSTTSIIGRILSGVITEGGVRGK